MQSASAAPLRVSDGEDSPSFIHEWNRLVHSDEERFCLGIGRGIPLLDSNVQRRVEERDCLRSRVTDKDIELTEFGFNFAEHLSDLFRVQHVRLNHETVGASFAYLCKRVQGGGLVLIIMHGYINVLLGQFEGDSSANATGTPGYQCVFSPQRHIC